MIKDKPSPQEIESMVQKWFKESRVLKLTQENYKEVQKEHENVYRGMLKLAPEEIHPLLALAIKTLWVYHQLLLKAQKERALDEPSNS